jgi:hypothetical protein
VLRSRQPHTASWIAIALFGALGTFALRILWPPAEGAEGFTLTPSVVIARYLEPVGGEAPATWTLYRDLALFAEYAHLENVELHLRPLTRWFRGSIVLLIAEVAAWIADLALS